MHTEGRRDQSKQCFPDHVETCYKLLDQRICPGHHSQQPWSLSLTYILCLPLPGFSSRVSPGRLLQSRDFASRPGVWSAASIFHKGLLTFLVPFLLPSGLPCFLSTLLLNAALSGHQLCDLGRYRAWEHNQKESRISSPPQHSSAPQGLLLSLGNSRPHGPAQVALP